MIKGARPQLGSRQQFRRCGRRADGSQSKVFVQSASGRLLQLSTLAPSVCNVSRKQTSDKTPHGACTADLVRIQSSVVLPISNGSGGRNGTGKTSQDVEQRQVD